MPSQLKWCNLFYSIAMTINIVLFIRGLIAMTQHAASIKIVCWMSTSLLFLLVAIYLDYKGTQIKEKQAESSTTEAEALANEDQ